MAILFYQWVSMGFNPIIKAHDSNSWQYYFINEIQPHDQTPRFKPMANYLSKAQFSLATSKTQFPLATSKSPVFIGNIKKTNFHWQYQKTQFSLAISKAQFTLALFYQKPKIINVWQKILCYNYFI